MSIYLHDIPLPVAQEKFQEALKHHHQGGILDMGQIPFGC